MTELESLLTALRDRLHAQRETVRGIVASPEWAELTAASWDCEQLLDYLRRNPDA